MASCCKLTVVPTGKALLQAPVPAATPASTQSMPAGVLTMRPPPVEAVLATTDRTFGTNVAVTLRGASIVV